MDTSDSDITFDDKGVCDHCRDFINNVLPNWNTGEAAQCELNKIVDRIKYKNRNKKYDCILGLSGGVDSSFMLHYAVTKLNLKPLVFHVDGGWNSELAMNNIEVLVDKLNLDLFTDVIDWEEMKEFQLACFRSGTPYLDLPQDHAFVATLYKYAEKHGIKTILNGGNLSTECVRNPLKYFYYGTDMFLINDILRKFAKKPIKSYPFSSVLNHKVYLKYIKGIEVVRPLNLIKYVKLDALKVLEQEYNWRPYHQKHYESRFTKFFEGYWLPKRFGFDTRRVQYSSLILTSQLNRDVALQLLEKPAIDPEVERQEIEFIRKKLGLSVSEFENFENLPKKFYWDYNNQDRMFKTGAKILKFFGVEKTIKR